MFDIEKTECAYSNGMKIIYGDFGDCGSGSNDAEKGTELHLKGISMIEGALIASRLFNGHNNRYILVESGDLTLEDDGGGQGFSLMGPAYYAEISKGKDGYVVIRYSPYER